MSKKLIESINEFVQKECGEDSNCAFTTESVTGYLCKSRLSPVGNIEEFYNKINEEGSKVFLVHTYMMPNKNNHWFIILKTDEDSIFLCDSWEGRFFWKCPSKEFENVQEMKEWFNDLLNAKGITSFEYYRYFRDQEREGKDIKKLEEMGEYIDSPEGKKLGQQRSKIMIKITYCDI